MKVMDFNQLSQIMSKIIISGRYKEMSKTKSKDDLIFLRQSNHCDFLVRYTSYFNKNGWKDSTKNLFVPRLSQKNVPYKKNWILFSFKLLCVSLGLKECVNRLRLIFL